MEMCDRCEYCSRISNFELFVDNKLNIVDALFCNNRILLDAFYNIEGGKRKSKKDQVDIEKMSPIMIGKVCWMCKGNYYKDRGASVFERKQQIKDRPIDTEQYDA